MLSCYAAYVPISVIGLSMTYRRAKGDQVIEPYVVTREHDPRKAARMSATQRAALGATGGTAGV